MTRSDDSPDALRDRDWGLTCAELLELTTEYLEGALPTADRTRFDTHLAECEGCSVVLDQLRDQIEMSGQLNEEHVDPESLARLLDAFTSWRR